MFGCEERRTHSMKLEHSSSPNPTANGGGICRYSFTELIFASMLRKRSDFLRSFRKELLIKLAEEFIFQLVDDFLDDF